MKNHVATYGYKNHVKVDAASKLIVAQKITSANMNDGRQLADLVHADDKPVFADCAYQNPSNRALIKQRNIENKIQVKGARHVALTAVVNLISLVNDFIRFGQLQTAART